jgi:dihydrolipoamide dehydrogenase
VNIAIIGAGPAGYVAALRIARLGGNVTVIEDYEVGGTCLNWGCIPTKTMIASSDLYAKVMDLETFGLDLHGTVVPNLAKIVDRKNRVVNTFIKSIRGLFQNWGIAYRQGRGMLMGRHEIAIAGKDGTRDTIHADKIIIATGSSAAEIPAFPSDGDNIITSTDALSLREIPKSLMIIGAGVIGSEFACLYRGLGTNVTVVEQRPRAVSTEDYEISSLFEKELKKKKIKLLVDTTVERIERSDDGMHIFLSEGRERLAEKVLITIGRTFNSAHIGLETVGIETGAQGEILVNEKMETNIPGIYAIGDVTGGQLLAHIASREGIVAANNSMGIETAMDYRVIPAVLFTSPEIASVGLREFEAIDKDIGYRKGYFQFRSSGKAHAMGEIAGLIKIISEKSSDRILGVHIIGPHASDLIHEAALAMHTGLTTKDVAGTIHAHPTLSEGIMEAADDAHGVAIHSVRKEEKENRSK